MTIEGVCSQLIVKTISNPKFDTCIFTEIVFNISLPIRPNPAICECFSVLLIKLYSLFHSVILFRHIFGSKTVAGWSCSSHHLSMAFKGSGTKELRNQYLLCLFVFSCGLFKYNNQQSGFLWLFHVLMAPRSKLVSLDFGYFLICPLRCGIFGRRRDNFLPQEFRYVYNAMRLIVATYKVFFFINY